MSRKVQLTLRLLGVALFIVGGHLASRAHQDYGITEFYLWMATVSILMLASIAYAVGSGLIEVGED